MYELLIKLEQELEYKKYTIETLEEMNKILKDLKTEEVKLKSLDKRKWLNGLYCNGVDSGCFRILFFSRCYMF